MHPRFNFYFSTRTSNTEYIIRFIFHYILFFELICVTVIKSKNFVVLTSLVTEGCPAFIRFIAISLHITRYEL